MGKVKKAGVCAGIAVGSLIGGTVSMIGKMTEKQVIDDLGENIMDSTILTGEIVGDAASGATNLISGAIRKEPKKIRKGKKELGKAGSRMVENVVANVKNVAEQSGEILEGVKEKDKKRVCKGVQTLGKMMVVGLLTVGAIKIDDDEESGTERKKDGADPKNGSGIEPELGTGHESEPEIRSGAAAGSCEAEGRAGGCGAGSCEVGASHAAEDRVQVEIKSGSEAERQRQSGPGAGSESAQEEAKTQEASPQEEVRQQERQPDIDATLPGVEELSMEALLKKQPTLEEELEKKIRF